MRVRNSNPQIKKRKKSTIKYLITGMKPPITYFIHIYCTLRYSANFYDQFFLYKKHKQLHYTQLSFFWRRLKLRQKTSGMLLYTYSIY